MPATEPSDRGELTRRLLGALSDGRIDECLSLLSPDVVIDLPFQPAGIGYWSHVVGTKAARVFLSSVPALFSPHRLIVDEVLPVSDQPAVIVRYHGEFGVRATGKPYRNTYIGVFRFEGRLISGWTEYHNPSVMLAAVTP